MAAGARYQRVLEGGACDPEINRPRVGFLMMPARALVSELAPESARISMVTGAGFDTDSSSFWDWEEIELEELAPGNGLVGAGYKAVKKISGTMVEFAYLAGAVEVAQRRAILLAA